ncbi:Helicase sen1 [Paramyrothecium foliicola]|nr:Helicase sen1 [Paramyrothecium foliicola]
MVIKEVVPVIGDMDQAVVPLHTFPHQDVFALRHEQGTLIEMQNETEILKRQNNQMFQYSGWPIAPISELTTSFVNTWLVLVKISKADEAPFPAIGDHFTIDMDAKIEIEQSSFSLVQLQSTRIENPYENLDCEEVDWPKKYAAFRVDVPRSWKRENEKPLELDLMATFQVASSIENVDSLTLSHQSCQKLMIRWDTNAVTFEAELAALRYFTESSMRPGRGPSSKAKAAFRMIQNFSDSWKDYYNLHDAFPHLKNPEHRFHKIPKELIKKFQSFTPDHKSAFEGLSRIPNGLYFVNGCPGAGKTEWNMVLSALIQSKRRTRSRRQHSPILFVVDINQAVDDAANRYFNLCKEVGLKLRIIRMHGFPYEMRHSDIMNRTTKYVNAKQTENEGDLDFTKRFLTTTSLFRNEVLRSKPDKAPTLDEAAVQYYLRHKEEAFQSLGKILDRMDQGEILGTDEWKALRSLVAMLYRAVLAQADFIATTPAACSGSFSKLFRPDVIFVDEAPHARELTTLIPIAWYNPLAWIFTGDVRQTRPFVKSGNKQDARRESLVWNPFANQLRLSTMARAEIVGAINSSLIINKRAYGNLQRLPSDIFYDGAMISGHDETARWPASACHLREYLSRFGTPAKMTENRVIVSLKESVEEVNNRSYWNPKHHAWVLQAIEALLKDKKFHKVDDASVVGSVMLVTPYSAAYRQYRAAVRQWPEDWQTRVSVLTVDRAQGNQADVVVLDMVRTTGAGFMDDPQRLNVAITRAHQAEIIVMHPRMTWKMCNGTEVRTNFTSQVWDSVEADGRVFEI